MVIQVIEEVASLAADAKDTERSRSLIVAYYRRGASLQGYLLLDSDAAAGKYHRRDGKGRWRPAGRGLWSCGRSAKDSRQPGRMWHGR